MTRRSGQWHLVGHDSDPVPADEWDVRGVAREHSRRGDQLEDARSVLDRLSRLEGWTGEAAESFAVKSHEATKDLDKAAEKYHAAARALESYAGAVSSARTTTWSALQRAESADATIRANPRSSVFSFPDPILLEQNPEEAERQRRQDQRHDLAVGELNDARNDVRVAVDALENAARRAAEQIRNASAIIKDGHWDNIKGSAKRWVRQHAEILDAIADGLEKIGMAIALIGIVVLVLAIAGVIGPVIGMVVAALGVAVAAAQLVIHLGLWKADTGKAGPADVVLDLVGVFGGKIASTLTKGATASFRAATSAATRNAVAASQAAVSQNAKNALRIADPTNNLRRWATGEMDKAASAARATIDRITATKAPWHHQLALDIDLADSIAQVRRLRSLDTSPEVLRHLDEATRLQIQAIKATAVVGVNDALPFVDAAAKGLVGHEPIKAAKDWVDDRVDDVVDYGHELHWRYTVVGK